MQSSEKIIVELQKIFQVYDVIYMIFKLEYKCVHVVVHHVLQRPAKGRIEVIQELI